MAREGTLTRIARALGISPDEICGDSSVAEHQEISDRSGWPLNLLVCESAPIALYGCAALMLERLRAADAPSLMLPTGRTATLLFEALLGDGMLDLSVLTETHLFIDAETFGVTSDHPASRQGFARKTLLKGLERSGVMIFEENRHFLSGVLSGDSDLAEYDALIARYRPTVHILAMSPAGEIIGYDPEEIPDISAHYGDRCRIIHMSGSGCSYLGPNQPSRAIVTIGLGNLFDAENILLPVLYREKAPALARLLSVPDDNTFPAVALRRHDTITIITSREIMDLFTTWTGSVFTSKEEIYNRIGQSDGGLRSVHPAGIPL